MSHTLQCAPISCPYGHDEKSRAVINGAYPDDVILSTVVAHSPTVFIYSMYETGRSSE